MHKKVDLRGLAPPEPVVRTKKLLAEFEEGILDVIVDMGPSREDLLHFAAFKKYNASVVAESATAVRLRIIKGNPPPEEPEAAKETRTEEKAAPREEKPAQQAQPSPPPAGESILLITSEGIGEDNRRLAVSLMVDMLRAALESDRRPAKIVLMNSGAALACDGSPALEALRKLVDAGAQVLVSAESLNSLGLREQLAVGTEARLKQVGEAILSAARVIRL